MNTYPFNPEFEKSIFNMEGFDSILNKYATQHKDMIKVHFEMMKHKFFIRKIKFEFLRDNLKNDFLLKEQKECFFDVFSVLQKCVASFSRFIHLIKYKKSKIYNTVDLYGDPILTKSRNTIVIYQNNTRYHFTLRELIKTINTSLSNSPYFFSEPVACKNPYTNLPFDKSALYNIYFAIKSSSYLMPVLFHQYFLTNFDLYQFSLKNEVLVRDYYVDSYLLNLSFTEEETIRDKVLSMFETYDITKIKINRNFPEERLLEIMRPYLNIYYKSRYYLQPSLRKYYSVILKYKLHEFVKFNPIFGRKYISYKKNIGGRIVDREVKYNDNHIPFFLRPTIYEMSHLSCDSSIMNEYRVNETPIVYDPNMIFNLVNNNIRFSNQQNYTNLNESDEEEEDDVDDDEEEEEDEENTMIPNEDDEESESEIDESDNE